MTRYRQEPIDVVFCQITLVFNSKSNSYLIPGTLVFLSVVLTFFINTPYFFAWRELIFVG